VFRIEGYSVDWSEDCYFPNYNYYKYLSNYNEKLIKSRCRNNIESDKHTYFMISNPADIENYFFYFQKINKSNFWFYAWFSTPFQAYAE